MSEVTSEDYFCHSYARLGYPKTLLIDIFSLGLDTEKLPTEIYLFLIVRLAPVAPFKVSLDCLEIFEATGLSGVVEIPAIAPVRLGSTATQAKAAAARTEMESWCFRKLNA